MAAIFLKMDFLFSMLFLTFFSVESLAQTYEAKYRCIYESGWKELKTDTSTNVKKLGIPMKITTIYTILTDGNYLRATATVEDAESIFQGAINFNFSSSEVIFDLKKRLAYFPETKEIRKIKEYSLKADSVFKDKYIIEGFKGGYGVELSADLQYFITPAVFFLNNQTGVTKVTTPSFTIELFGSIKQVDEKLSYSDFFSSVSSKNLKEEYSFFE